MSYKPPFTITPTIVLLIANISEKLGALSVLHGQDSGLRLRRINRIRTIQGSLAIEGNSLTEQQITAVMEGKTVIAPMREVQEVGNACNDNTPQVTPYVTPQVKRLISAFKGDMTREALMFALALQDPKLCPAIEEVNK